MKALYILFILAFGLSLNAQTIYTGGKKSYVPELQFVALAINDSFPIDTGYGYIAEFQRTYVDTGAFQLPPSYTPDGTPTRMVFVAHGAGGGVSGGSSYIHERGLNDSLLANGYLTFDVQGKILQNMGGSWVQQSAIKMYKYLLENYNVYPEIFVHGMSMGGCTSSNFVDKHRSIVKAHTMYSPVLDLYNQAWLNPWLGDTKSSLARAYNFDDKSGTTWEPEKVVGYNPIAINTFNDSLKIWGVPCKLWHGDIDAVVVYDYSNDWYNYIRNAGGYCEYRVITNMNHNMSGGNTYLDRELIMFYRRFD